MSIKVGDALYQLGIDKGNFDADMNKISASIKKHHKAIGIGMTAVGAAVIGGMALATKAAASFDSAMREVNTMMNLNEKEFAELIEKADPDFAEIKSYMFVGYSRKRLEIENMPLHTEVKQFAEKINEHLGYHLAGESKPSRVVLLSKKEGNLRIERD